MMTAAAAAYGPENIANNHVVESGGPNPNVAPDQSEEPATGLITADQVPLNQTESGHHEGTV
jgi:hypothetical protein